MEDETQPGVTGIVLAGGRSSRMGRPKALLPLGTETLVARVVASLREVTHDVVVVAAPGQELPALRARVVRDEVAYLGPLSGIVRGLAAAGSELCVVAPCDAGFFAPALMRHLLAGSAARDVVVPRWDGRLQPLHAVYRTSIGTLFGEALASGERRPAALFSLVRTRIVEEAEVAEVDPAGWSFLNVNTPDDYRVALARSLLH